MTTVELALRRVYGAYPQGVVAVAGLVGGRPAGIAASSFVPVSLNPPLVSVCVAHTSSTWPLLRDLPRIGISVLAAHQERIGRQLGSRTGDRFSGVAWRSTPDGCVFIEGAASGRNSSDVGTFVAKDGFMPGNPFEGDVQVREHLERAFAVLESVGRRGKTRGAGEGAQHRQGRVAISEDASEGS